MARRGAQPGNQNARKHGFYSRTLEDADRKAVEAAGLADGFDEELAILRLKLRQLLQQSPDRLDLQMTAINMIARLVRMRHNLAAGHLAGLAQRPNPLSGPAGGSGRVSAGEDL